MATANTFIYQLISNGRLSIYKGEDITVVSKCFFFMNFLKKING